MMRSSYRQDDVVILLKDVTGLLRPLDTQERERRIQIGVHYSEMLPLEYCPTPQYLELYRDALQKHARATAAAIAVVSEKVYRRHGNAAVLVSLARAGTPVGILVKRYLHRKYHVCVPHYSISIIRGRGIDKNAISYILARHRAVDIQFVDGWIGKGAIIRELQKETAAYPELNPELAVLADPAGLTACYGTREDFLIPSSCLNATVSGLFSRTILNGDVIGPQDFHGAAYYDEWERQDLSNNFLAGIEAHFDAAESLQKTAFPVSDAADEIAAIAERFGVTDINFIKPGIGETTRVLLRRVPWLVLVRDPADSHHTAHIARLCRERGVEMRQYPLKHYRACGIIRNLHADV